MKIIDVKKLKQFLTQKTFICTFTVSFLIYLPLLLLISICYNIQLDLQVIFIYKKNKKLLFEMNRQAIEELELENNILATEERWLQEALSKIKKQKLSLEVTML